MYINAQVLVGKAKVICSTFLPSTPISGASPHVGLSFQRSVESRSQWRSYPVKCRYFYEL